MARPPLTTRQQQILDVIQTYMAQHGYPPSVRDIGEDVGLASPSTVHTHLATLERLGYIRRDPTKPRALELCYDGTSSSTAERRPVRHVPVLGNVAAGTGVLAEENIEELLPVPVDLAGDGELFIVKVRGDSMMEAGILDGDYVVVRSQPSVEQGEIAVVGIPGEEATVKIFTRHGPNVTLIPANSHLRSIHLSVEEVVVYGRVVSVMRKI